MAFAVPGAGAHDYSPCRYGTSKLLFRGPGHDLSGDYVAVLGGTDAYGKYVRRPYPELVEGLSGVPVVNLGCVNAGPDAYLNDPGTLEVAGRAQVAVVQVMGATNLSNRLYAVHPRRNDRFLRASPALRALFPQVDFTEFHFIRHMLSALQTAAPDRFEVVAEELRTAWVARMTALLTHLPEVVLLWLGDRPPPAPGAPADLHHEPRLVDSAMIGAIRPKASVWVEVVDGTPASVPPGGLPLPTGMPGPETHRAAAQALADVVRRLI
ncbi:MAG: DUF6473 family protein [Paracoccaceae bacterium]